MKDTFLLRLNRFYEAGFGIELTNTELGRVIALLETLVDAKKTYVDDDYVSDHLWSSLDALDEEVQ